MVFARGKFHTYMYGRELTVVTNHKPLIGVFGKGKATRIMASSGIIRWAGKLSAYDFRLEYGPGTDNGNTDCLSRLPYDKGMAYGPTSSERVHFMNL